MINMKLAIFIVLTALLGIGSCKLLCLQFKTSKCHASGSSDNPICASRDETNELITCLRRGARECEVENLPIVRDAIDIYSATCTEGTEMNNLYKKHKTCMYQTAAPQNVGCVAPMFTELLRLGIPSQTREYQVKVLRVACKYADSANQCIDDNVNTTCGDEAARFYTRMTNPSFRLSQKVCEELKSDNNGINYSRQQQQHQSVQVMAPHIQQFSAIGPHAGIIRIASTVAPGMFAELMNAATINVSSNLIYILLATLFMKWFSPY